MSAFISYRTPLAALLERWICEPFLHARWLNTLSYLENCGAKAIAAFQHPTRVSTCVLKHAAEEFRHAYYLKAQISKLWPRGFVDYRLTYLLGGFASKHYLHRLNAAICRDLLPMELGANFRQTAYVLVTYAIEGRAQELYGEYQRLLSEAGSVVSVIGILRDEEGHLEEMERQLTHLPCGTAQAEMALACESKLCNRWLRELTLEPHAVGTGGN
jgi:hypothetical protein